LANGSCVPRCFASTKRAGWTSRIGRRSFYRLSDKGLRLTRRAENKIYRAELPAWTANGCCCSPKGWIKPPWPTSKAADLAGFGTLAPSLMASPSQHLADVQSLLHDAGVAENVIFLKPTRRWRSRAALRSRVEECWQLTEQNAMYESFINSFRRCCRC
jgi:phenylacetic acid degradation operon negative regulatory protein